MEMTTTKNARTKLHDRSDAELAPAAERIGCSIQALRDASMHVELGERFPFLRHLPAWAAAHFHQLLDDLPEREQYLAAARMIGLRADEALRACSSPSATSASSRGSAPTGRPREESARSKRTRGPRWRSSSARIALPGGDEREDGGR